MKIVKSIFACSAALFMGLGIISCEKDPGLSARTPMISVKVGVGGGDVSTKASMPTINRVIPMDDGYSITEYVSDYSCNDVPSTKGMTNTTSSINVLNSQFIMHGWLGPEIQTAEDASEDDQNNQHFINYATVTRSSTEWNMDMTEYWRNDINTTFWSYYIPTGSSTSTSPTFTYLPGSTPTEAELNHINFTYSLPLPSGTDGALDAQPQTDFLIAYNNTKRTSTDTDGSMDILFYHPLAAVKFDIGTISGGTLTTDNDYVNITKVELIGVKTTCNFTANGYGTNACSFSAVSSGSGTYVETASRAQIAGGHFTDDDSQFVFFMLPQSLDGVKVRVTMQRRVKNIIWDSTTGEITSVTWSDDLKTIIKEVSLSGANWLSGKYYTYRINADVPFEGTTIDWPSTPDDPGNVLDDEGRFHFAGSDDGNYVLGTIPNTSGIKIVKVTFKSIYKNASGKSVRSVRILDDVEHPTHYSTDETLVSAALADPDFDSYRPSDYNGRYELKGKSPETTRTDVMYFYIGGLFDKIAISFEYAGSTGGGSVYWDAPLPTFEIVEFL